MYNLYFGVQCIYCQLGPVVKVSNHLPLLLILVSCETTYDLCESMREKRLWKSNFCEVNTVPE